MIETAERAFEGRDGFHSAVLEVLGHARREVLMADPDFQAWPLATAAGEQALKQALLRGARLRLLIAKPGWLERHGDRFHRVRRVFADRIALRTVPESLRFNESLLLADRLHLVRRVHPEHLAGRLILANAVQVESRASRLDALWEESADCLPATTLGL